MNPFRHKRTVAEQYALSKTSAESLARVLEAPSKHRVRLTMTVNEGCTDEVRLDITRSLDEIMPAMLHLDNERTRHERRAMAIREHVVQETGLVPEQLSAILEQPWDK